MEPWKNAGRDQASWRDRLSYFKLDRVQHILSLSERVRRLTLDYFPEFLMRSTCQTSSEWNERGFQSEQVLTEDRGRSKYNISEEKLQYFLAFGFKFIRSLLLISFDRVRGQQFESWATALFHARVKRPKWRPLAKQFSDTLFNSLQCGTKPSIIFTHPTPHWPLSVLKGQSEEHLCVKLNHRRLTVIN